METVKTMIWVLDDVPSNFELVRRSLPEPGITAYQLVHYECGEDALLELEVLLTEDGGAPFLPDIVFMDFYMGEKDGAQVTREMNTLFAQRERLGPFIIGHSSVYHCSELIQRSGGHAAISKNSRSQRSADIVRLFPDLASIAAYAGRGQRSLS